MPAKKNHHQNQQCICNTHYLPKKMVCTIELITFDDGNFRDVMKLVIFNIFNHLSKSGEWQILSQLSCIHFDFKLYITMDL